MARTATQLAAAKSRQAANTAKKGGGSSGSPADAYSALMNKYAASANPSKDETKTQKKLTGMETDKASSIADAVGRPVMSGFVTGQQAAIENRYAGLEQPLTTKLSTLMQQRGASSDIMSKELAMMTQNQQNAINNAQQDRQISISGQNAATSAAAEKFRESQPATGTKTPYVGDTKYMGKKLYTWDGTKWTTDSGSGSSTTTGHFGSNG